VGRTRLEGEGPDLHDDGLVGVVGLHHFVPAAPTGLFLAVVAADLRLAIEDLPNGHELVPRVLKGGDHRVHVVAILRVDVDREDLIPRLS
jgi:hypothetical protein